jgi:hypothetical protein
VAAVTPAAVVQVASQAVAALLVAVVQAAATAVAVVTHEADNQREQNITQYIYNKV